MSVATGREAREVLQNQQLNPDQSEYFTTRLERGQCIISLGTTWKEPLLCSFPYRKQEKQITNAARKAAEERINRYAPPDPPAAVQSDQSKDEHSGPGQPKRTADHPLFQAIPEASEPRPNEEKPPERPQEQSSKAREYRRKPPLKPPDHEPDEPRHVPIKITTVEERVLRTSAERIRTTTQTYDKANVSRQPGNNACAKLERLSLLTATSILVRAGRGGNAVVLEPTAAAFELLGRPRPAFTKGGDSAQHRWLIQELAAHCPDAAVEFTLGGKGMDIFFRYDPHKHEPIVFYIEEKLPAGALIAIEVEVSDPVTTGTNNVTKNAAVGITHTIVAVLPRHLRSTRTGLAKRLPDLHGAYTVVDVFGLIEELDQ